jgi:hypothetical protein
MKLVFLGTGSAFTLENYQSNMVVDGSDGLLLIDCGSDVRRSIADQGWSAFDLTDVYVSHLHADHIGGLEWLGFVSYFGRSRADPSARPRLHIRRNLIEGLWQSLHGGMGSLEGEVASLETYFDMCPIDRNGSFTFSGTKFQTVQVVHYYDGYEIVPTYGLMFENNKICVFITTDTQFTPNQMKEFRDRSTYIFQDCETSPFQSGVHTHYEELSTLQKDLKQRIWLYDYQDGDKPDSEADGFLGWVEQGQVFDFNDPQSFKKKRFRKPDGK